MNLCTLTEYVHVLKVVISAFIGAMFRSPADVSDTIRDLTAQVSNSAISMINCFT